MGAGRTGLAWWRSQKGLPAAIRRNPRKSATWKVAVGAASDDIRLEGDFEITED